MLCTTALRVMPHVAHRRGASVETQYGWNSLVNVLCPSWRLEPVGAEGQLGSMAAGNNLMLPLTAEGAQV